MFYSAGPGDYDEDVRRSMGWRDNRRYDQDADDPYWYRRWIDIKTDVKDWYATHIIRQYTNHIPNRLRSWFSFKAKVLNRPSVARTMFYMTILFRIYFFATPIIYLMVDMKMDSERKGTNYYFNQTDTRIDQSSGTLNKDSTFHSPKNVPQSQGKN